MEASEECNISISKVKSRLLWKCQLKDVRLGSQTSSAIESKDAKRKHIGKSRKLLKGLAVAKLEHFAGNQPVDYSVYEW